MAISGKMSFGREALLVLMAQIRLEEAFRGQEGNLERGEHKRDSLMESYWGVCMCLEMFTNCAGP